jgi:hypothetical protein
MNRTKRASIERSRGGSSAERHSSDASGVLSNLVRREEAAVAVILGSCRVMSFANLPRYGGAGHG